MPRKWIIGMLLVTTALLGACANANAPDIKHLPQSNQKSAHQMHYSQ